MKNLLRISILFIAGILVTTSCDDYVDAGPLYSEDAESFFVTPNDYDRALIGAYDLLQTSYLSLWLGEIASDNAIAGGESVTDSQGLHEIDAMTHNGQNRELQQLWRFMYSGITRVNYIFENRNKIEFEGKDKIMAQASFLRAYYYFELVKVFGAVPLIIDKRLGAEEIKSTVRNPATEVYAQIEDDLLYAASILDWTATQKGRITKGAALSLLGKAYLYQNKFDEAAEAFEEVIDKGIYDLYDDFSSLFRVANENNMESVFEIQYVNIEGGGYDCFVCLEGFAAVGFHGIRGYQGPIYLDGNSYNLPTDGLYKAFSPGDPRRDASILDIAAFAAAQADPSQVKWVEGNGGHTGYYNNKYIKRAAEPGPGDDDLTSPVNHRVIRFSDVLLMAAEAHNRKASPNDELAREYLNRVRDRVDLDPVSASGADLREAIWSERRFEFAGEGHRFFDLVRTGKASEAIQGFTVGKNELFPISQDEIDLAGAGWSQNDNY
jgi:starch-binding outer membrane protein, SusD/RagB family